MPRDMGGATLVSRHFVPAQMQPGAPDHRRLGLAVGAVAFDGVAIDLASLGASWHTPEPGMRWTDGRAQIDLSGQRSLTITPALHPLYRDDTPIAGIQAA